MYESLGWFALGVALVALGADSLVKGLQALAVRAGVSTFAVGVLAATFGGSVPDLAVNIDAVGLDHTALALGNIVGSCLVNLGLVLGLAAMMRPLQVGLPLIGPLLGAAIGMGGVLLAMSWNGRIGWYDGMALLAIFAVLAWFAATHVATRRYQPAHAGLESAGTTRGGGLRTALRLVVGLVLLVYGADVVVFRAVELARHWEVSELFVGLTLVAIGTSVPQLVVALAAARGGRGDEVVAGVVGSNLFNLTLILGATALISPPFVAETLVQLEIPAVIAFSVALYPMLRGDREVQRHEGAILLAAFGALLALQIWLVTR